MPDTSPPVAPAIATDAAAATLLDTLPHGLLVLEEQGVVRLLNQRAATWWGLAAAAAMGRPLAQVGAGQLPTPVFAALWQAAAGRLVQGDYWLPAAEQWVALTSAVQPTGEMVVHWQDVTAWKEAAAGPPPSAPLSDADKYRTLLHNLDEGVALVEVLLDAAGQPADYRFLEVNPAFARQAGFADAVGRTMSELVPASEPYWVARYGQVALSGEPQRFEAYAAVQQAWYDVYATRSGDAAGRRVALVFSDITARKQAEAALRANETRQAFLLRLADVLHPLASPTASASAACRLLVEQLAASRGQYTQLQGEPGAESGGVGGEYVRPGQPLPRHFLLAAYGEPAVTQLRAGHAVVLTDATHDPRLTAAQRAAFAAGESLAAIVVPIMKAGCLVAVLTVYDTGPRCWTDAEVALVAEAAERTWATVERARAEVALRDSERRLQLAMRASRQFDWEIDWQTGLVTYSGYQQATLGFELPETVADWFALAHPDDMETSRQAYAQALATHTPMLLEQRLLVPGGHIWVRIDGQFFGTPARFVGTTRNITETKVAEEALRESETRLSLALQAARMGSFEWTSDGNRLVLSPTARELFGLLPDEDLATSNAAFALVHPADRAQHQALFEQAALLGADYQSLYRVVRPHGGQVRWLEELGRGARAPGTDVTYLRGVQWDVTERVEAQRQLAELSGRLEQQVAERTRELRESRDVLQSILDTSLIAMSVMQAERDATGAVTDFRLVVVNKELERQTGRHDLLGKRYAQEYPGIVPTGIYELLLRALETGQPQGMEYYYHNEGFDQWFSCQFVKLGDGVVATNLDITERKTAEQERSRNLQLLTQAEKVAGLGSWDYEPASGTLYWSAGMYQLFGLPFGQPVSPAIYLSLVTDEDRPLAEQLVAYLTTQPTDFELTLCLRVAGGTSKPIRVKSVVLADAQGRPARLLGVDLDISQVKRLEADNLRLHLSQQQALFQAVQAAQEEERRRVSEALHNGIGQLLYAVKLQLDRLPPLPQEPARREAARLLGDAIRQTRVLSHELTPALLEEFGLEAALQRICRTLSAPTLHWHCQVVLDEGPALSAPLQLAIYRLAQELAQNVVKHAQASEGMLEVEALPAWAVLRVEDNGQGFDPARTSDGLGLRTLRSRVALLGGSVHLTTAPGQGTHYQIHLPLNPNL